MTRTNSTSGSKKNGSRHILVTGCAGFIGSSFVDYVIANHPHIKIVGVDNLSTGRRSAINKAIDFFEGSILDEDFLRQIFNQHNIEYVFHFAALPRISFSVNNPVLTTRTNVEGTVSLLTVAKDYQVKRVVFSSSSSIYGGADRMPTTETENPANPKSPYAVQKYAGELMCRVYSNIFDLDTVCLRYFTVFGPGQYGDSPYSTVISAWLESLYYPEVKKGFIEGDGEQSRDFCYVDNVVRANLLAMEAPGKLNGMVLNIAHGEQTSLNKARKLIEKYSKQRLSLEQRPPRLGDVRHTYADISLAKKIIGYEPNVNFEEGIKRTVEWFENRRLL